MRRSTRWWAVLAFVPFMVGASPLSAQSGGWRPDERVLVTDFGIVTALARSPGSVYVATAGGLIVIDEAFERTELPITLEDGYPPWPVTALVYDHRDGTLWLASGGDLLQFDPFSRRFRDRIRIGQPVSQLVPAEASGSDVFLRVGREWWRVDTFSRDRRRADPGIVRAAIDSRSDLRDREEALRDPFFIDGAEQAARDWSGRPVRILDVTPARDAYGWWLATAGDFLVQYDRVGRTGQRMAYGPKGGAMASVAATDRAVWFAPAEGLEGRYGVAEATRDLQNWRVWRADSSRAVPDRVRKLLRVRGGVWAGGESGLHWLEDGQPEWREERDVDLSYQPVLSLAPATGPVEEGVWVGTARGLLRVRAAGAGPDLSVLPGEAVGSVVEASGIVWIGTAHGLYSMVVPDSIGQSTTAARIAGPSPLRSPVGALVASGDTVYAALDREVWWRPGRQSEWMRVESVGRSSSPITALDVSEGVLWAGSATEVTVSEVGRGVLGRYLFGPDLPPTERGLTGIAAIAIVSRSEAWLALPSGALRLEVRH